MWSEFIDAKEQMTDYFLINGQIVHQITYIYLDQVIHLQQIRIFRVPFQIAREQICV